MTVAVLSDYYSLTVEDGLLTLSIEVDQLAQNANDTYSVSVENGSHTLVIEQTAYSMQVNNEAVTLEMP